MLKHHGVRRKYNHNIKAAALLSLVAGMVNVAGFLSVKVLTTNVTGHFAFFIDEMFKLNFSDALIFFLYIFFFFIGSFISSLLVEILFLKNKPLLFYTVPATLECLIITWVGIKGASVAIKNPYLIAFALLFSMGIQNALVTKISNAIVRTTHLTGLFTDLGIELSQLFFHHHKSNRHQLKSSIKLRLIIVLFFFAGGILSGILFNSLGLSVLIVAAIILALGIIYNFVN